MCKVASSSSQNFSWKSSTEVGCLTLSKRTAQRMSKPSFISLTLHLQLQPHWIKALFPGSRPRWIQPKSVLAQTVTLEAPFLEAVQDLEATSVKDRPHIRTQRPHSPPGTIQEIATVSEAEHLAVLDTSLKVEAALEATMETLLESLMDKVRASVLGCLTWVLEAT